MEMKLITNAALSPSNNLTFRTCSVLCAVTRNINIKNVCFRATTMNSGERKISPAPPLPPVSTSNKIVVAVDIILYMTEVLSSADCRSFIRALYPNDEEDYREILWRLSTYDARTTFLNGQQLNIRYNFNLWRRKEDCILISVNSLLPIFGGIVLPLVDGFMTVSNLRNFVKIHVNLNTCSDYQYASCACHLLNKDGQRGETFLQPSSNVDTCGNRHSHHYCSQHLIDWLDLALAASILLRETRVFVNEEGAKNFLPLLRHHFSTVTSPGRSSGMDGTVHDSNSE
ncbi:c4.1 [Tranosema rostrale ichnovirus]|nr:c4.1 [Tranosema rostrale ichnovirus]